MVATAEKKYTIEEYLALEKTAETRHEFVHGKLIPMPGESKKANIIALNGAFALRQALKGKPFQIFAHDVKLIVEVGGIYRYPDVMVAPIADDADTHAILQPVLLMEVMSENSADTDRGAKLLEYTQLPSLQHYLIISQSEYLVEVYSRRAEDWRFSYSMNPTDTIELTALDVSIAIKDLYEGVAFAAAAKDQ